MTFRTEHLTDGKVTLHCGDCLDVFGALEANSVDACVTDPPYHLTNNTGTRSPFPGQYTPIGKPKSPKGGFMGKAWDGGDIAFRPELWREVFRVIKPGAYVVAFSSSRTYHRMACAIEDAGFITHPLIAWLTGQGFPKATRVDSPEWEGWRYGTQSLKPAIEPIYAGQKPFENGLTGTENVLKWGVGALNIDGCRVGSMDVAMEREGEPSQDRRYTENGGTNIAAKPGMRRSTARPQGKDIRGGNFGGGAEDKRSELITGGSSLGRWPANVILSDDPEVQGAFPDVSKSPPIGAMGGGSAKHSIYGDFAGERHENGYGDTGSAARFFYTAKADALDRLGSKHPTVKPLDLMQYLVRLVTPPKGLCLDPFAGTGTTGEACIREGFRAILIERELEYQEDIRRRMRLAMCGPSEREREAMKAKMKDKPVDVGPLFAGIT